MLLTGRDAVLAAAGDTPYTRAHTAGGEVVGYHDGELTAWVAEGPWGQGGCVLAASDTKMGIAEAVAVLPQETGRTWWQMTPGTSGLQPVAQRAPWTFLWAPEPPPLTAAAKAVTRVEDMDAVSKVLAESLPDAGGKPGDPKIHAWYGIYDNGTLAACAADKSTGGVGFLSSVAVLKAYQGKGFGSGLTTSMGQELYRAHGRLALAVEDHTPGAIKLYRRLGFTEGLQRVSLQL
jgi:ribosomal protein S18 acetylase RimI-like enzyme